MWGRSFEVDGERNQLSQSGTGLVTELDFPENESEPASTGTG